MLKPIRLIEEELVNTNGYRLATSNPTSSCLSSDEHELEIWFYQFLIERDPATYSASNNSKGDLVSLRIYNPFSESADVGLMPPHSFVRSNDLLYRHIWPLLSDKEQIRYAAKLSYDFLNIRDSLYMHDIHTMSAMDRLKRIQETIIWCAANPNFIASDHRPFDDHDPTPEDIPLYEDMEEYDFSPLGQDDIDSESLK